MSEELDDVVVNWKDDESEFVSSHGWNTFRIYEGDGDGDYPVLIEWPLHGRPDKVPPHGLYLIPHDDHNWSVVIGLPKNWDTLW